MIPMVDLQIQHLAIKTDIEQGLQEALKNCQFILGPSVKAFEAEAAEYLGVQHAVGCASGTDALILSMLACGVGHDDEVITSAFTFAATAEAIARVGARPVFVDIHPDSFNIDITEIERAITKHTKAVIPVHLFGQPADISEIKTLCDAHSLTLIEDCAQSFGAHIDHRMTGSTGDCGAFSFYPTKNLGCYGDGGMITTDSDEIADQLKLYRNHGSRVKYQHEVVGFNSRLDELQAVVLRVKMKHIDEYNRERRRVAHAYNALLEDTRVITPHEDKIGRHIYHQYTILAANRKQITEHLKQQGIAYAIYYPMPLHRQKAFFNTKQPALPITEKIADECLSLPLFPEMKQEQIERVVNAIKEVLTT